VIMVDTSAWIDFLRGENSMFRHILHELIEGEEEIAITGIILTEILQGIKEERPFRTTRDFLLEFPAYEPVSITWIRAASIYKECRKNGNTPRSTIDCLIAAVCLEHDFTVLHKDRDYEIIAKYTGLKVMKIKGTL